MTDQSTPQYGAPAFGEQPPAPPAPAKKKSTGKKVLGIVGIVVIALVIGAFKVGVREWFSAEDKTADAKAGDCLSALPAVAEGQETEASAEVLSCTDAAAAYTVLGRVDNQTEAQAQSPEVCAEFPETELAYRAMPESGPGYVLCIKPLDR